METYLMTLPICQGANSWSVTNLAFKFWYYFHVHSTCRKIGLQFWQNIKSIWQFLKILHFENWKSTFAKSLCNWINVANPQILFLNNPVTLSSNDISRRCLQLQRLLQKKSNFDEIGNFRLICPLCPIWLHIYFHSFQRILSFSWNM